MKTDLLTVIFQCVYAVISILLTGVAIPWIKTKIGESKYRDLIDYTERAVRAAKQTFPEYANEEKKKYVLEYITDKTDELGLDLTDQDIENMIEGIYNSIKEGAKSGN